jgi:hypothetical protein
MAYWCDDAAHGREQERLDAEQARALERMARTRTAPFRGPAGVAFEGNPGSGAEWTRARFEGARD